jgi:formylglycine-generating enzyme required for sulfatase activity
MTANWKTRTAVAALTLGVLVAGLNLVLPAAAAQTAAPDTLVLDTGETLSGAVVNEVFNLRTAYGGLKLERSWIASLDFTGDPHGLQTLVTVNSNRITGFLEETTVAFQPQGGSRNEIRRGKISQIRLVARTVKIPSSKSPTWVRLKGGDVLSGRLLPDPLPLLITNTQVAVSLNEISALVLTTNRTTPARLFLRNGKVFEAELAADFVSIQLDAGPTVELDGPALATICESHALAAVEGSRIKATADGASASPEIFTASSSTNLQGLVWIPPGEFLMGSPYDEVGRGPDEGQRQVVISQGFWIGKCEVSQAEYEKVMSTNPSNSNQDPNLPVERVNWFESMDYCGRLTRLAETAGWLPPGYAFRLPTEAEWEYCCRAGTTTAFSSGNDGSDARLGLFAWFNRNSDFGAKPVATRQPNPWGLYDMHGNVWEWCFDRWDGFLQGSRLTNNPAPATGSLRVARGGSWLYDAKACRCANRDDYSPANRCSDIGFRIVLAPLGPS